MNTDKQANRANPERKPRTLPVKKSPAQILTQAQSKLVAGGKLHQGIKKF
jgi:hypothetical protein